MLPEFNIVYSMNETCLLEFDDIKFVHILLQYIISVI